ncbi:MAG TPA: class I SAM-dependent methyltransferase [Fimbriimonadaceae bacterium]|nr:class I SAM-dependent methyltransferase [Fimbriimonadaceae bacterium]
MEWSDIPGWFDYADLYDRAVREAPVGGTLSELGCWFGRSTCYLAQRAKESGKRLQIIVIDTFLGTEGDAVHKGIVPSGSFRPQFEDNMNRAGVLDLLTVIEEDAATAHRRIPTASLDFLFIDGDHSYAAVRRDILNFRSKVRQGGILAGHDYGHSAEVRRAVDEIFGPCPASVASWAIRV